MKTAQMRKLLDVASGRIPADVVIENARIVHVCSGEIEHASIAVCDGIIAGIGRYAGHRVHDARGMYACPGLIDAHVHIESSLVSPEQFASAVIPRGTTAVIADPHEIANVCGTDGLNYMIEASKRTPLSIFFMLPSCVPAVFFEHAGASLTAADLEPFMHEPHVLGLGELMDVHRLIAGDADVVKKVMLARRASKVLDGHAPMLSGRELCAYAASGVKTDHECTTVQEMHERISRGMYVMLREGSAARDLDVLLAGVTSSNADRCLFCTDDRQVDDILRDGHIDVHLRKAVIRGIPAVTALRMASLNPAACYGLSDHGMIAPGCRADFFLTEDLTEFRAREVYISGVLTAADGEPLCTVPVGNYQGVSETVHVKKITPENFTLKLTSRKAHVISITPGSLVTGKSIRDVAGDEFSNYVHESGSGIMKLAVLERHGNSGDIGIALVEHYGSGHGAIALSIAHDSHNIIAAGTNDHDMALAVNRIMKAGGGIAVAADGTIEGFLPLPIAGLMANLSAQETASRLAHLRRAAGSRLQVTSGIDPIMTLSFLALPVIPELKLTDQGLYDVTAGKFIDVSV